jgi:YesN/AraC family two-component response regulator
MNYERIKPSKSNVYYPLAKEQQLMNKVKLGDYKAVESIIDEIYSINFVERDIPVKLAQYLLNNLISSMFRVLEELTLDLDVLFESGNGPDIDISGMGSVDEVFSYIKRSLGRVCEIITEKKNSHNTQLRDKIIEYISTFYWDRNLSLTSVADKFNLTTPYLSRFFKEQTGYNFNDYLNQCRTKNAKALLKESGFTIAEIAERIGYNSPGTFIRIFKKYESITPGQYREVFSNIKI